MTKMFDLVLPELLVTHYEKAIFQHELLENKLALQ
jgi:hypothetical protein